LKKQKKLKDNEDYAREIKKRANNYDDLGAHLNDEQKKKILMKRLQN